MTNMKYLLTTMCVLLVATMSLTADAQARKRGGAKRKATTTATISNIKQSNKTLKSGSTEISITHYDAPAYYKLTDKEKIGFSNGYCNHSFSMDWPTSLSSGNIAAMQKWLLKKATKEDSPTPQDIMTLIRHRNQCDEGGQKVAQIPDTKSSQPLSAVLNITATLITNNIIMFDFAYDEYYGGGTHGSYNYGHSCYYYELSKQKEIEASDLFRPSITSLIAKQLKADEYWDVLYDDFKLKPQMSQSVMLSQDVVKFFYSRYEIAPGFAGEIEVSIPLADAKNHATPMMMTIVDAMLGKTTNYHTAESAPVGQLTVYTAASVLRNFTTEPFEIDDYITDSNSPFNRFENQNKTTYRYTFYDDGDMYSTTIEKSKINIKQYEMSQLPASIIGDKTMFKAADGSTAQIFRSSNNGHYYRDENGKRLPDTINKQMDGCYVLSVLSVSKWSNDKVLFEEQLEVSNGNLKLYMIPQYSKGTSREASYKHSLVGMVTDKWRANDSWDSNKSSYDPKGNLLTDQIQVSCGLLYENYEDGWTDYCSIAYIADLDALYFNGKLYYRQKDKAPTIAATTAETNTSNEKVYNSVECPPKFPGGDAALFKYLASHIQYPTMAQENYVQGTVVVQFVVEKDGSIGEVKVARSVDSDLDKEAVRLVKTLPNFIPGRQDGEPVRVWYTFPVNFRLQGTK